MAAEASKMSPDATLRARAEQSVRAPKPDPVHVKCVTRSGKADQVRQKVSWLSTKSDAQLADRVGINVDDSIDAQTFKNLASCIENGRYVPRFEWRQDARSYHDTTETDEGTLAHSIIAHQHLLRLIKLVERYGVPQYLDDALSDLKAISKRSLRAGIRTRYGTKAQDKRDLQLDAVSLHATGVRLLGEDLYYQNPMFEVYLDLMKWLRSCGCPTDRMAKEAAAYPKMARYVMENLLDMVEEEQDFADRASDEDEVGDNRRMWRPFLGMVEPSQLLIDQGVILFALLFARSRTQCAHEDSHPLKRELRGTSQRLWCTKSDADCYPAVLRRLPDCVTPSAARLLQLQHLECKILSFQLCHCRWHLHNSTRLPFGLKLAQRFSSVRLINHKIERTGQKGIQNCWPLIAGVPEPIMTEVWDQYKHRLIGGWRAISYELRDSDSPTAKVVAKPHGDNPLGRAVVTPNGFLSAHLSIPERLTGGPLPSGKPWQTGEDKEVAWVARGLSMYCGYLKLLQEESSRGEEGLWWETTVEVCSDPARFGGKERRKVKFVKDDREGKDGGELMELRPFQDLVTEDGQKLRGVLTWEKFE